MTHLDPRLFHQGLIPVLLLFESDVVTCLEQHCYHCHHQVDNLHLPALVSSNSLCKPLLEILKSICMIRLLLPSSFSSSSSSSTLTIGSSCSSFWSGPKLLCDFHIDWDQNGCVDFCYQWYLLYQLFHHHPDHWCLQVHLCQYLYWLLILYCAQDYLYRSSCRWIITIVIVMTNFIGV